MKKYLALGLLSSLLLTSCSVDWNDAKEKRIEELEIRMDKIEKQIGKTSSQKGRIFDSNGERIKTGT